MVDQERSRSGLDKAASRLAAAKTSDPSVEPGGGGGLSGQVLTAAPHLFVLCDNRPGVGRNGAGAFHRKRSQPTGRLSKRAPEGLVGSTFGAS